MSDQPALNPLLLELLRCPVAVRAADYGPDPGRLRLKFGGGSLKSPEEDRTQRITIPPADDTWLVCDESGLKYPIRDGIAIMLVDEGEKWRATAEADLPVPPPAA